MSKLDFSGLDVIFLIGKRDRGEELSEDEMRIVEKFEEESAARKRFKSAYFQNKPVREAANRKNAAKALMDKYCPLRNDNCIGEECAMFKLVERQPTLEERYSAYTYGGPDRQYDAMCGYNIPERGSRIVRR